MLYLTVILMSMTIIILIDGIFFLPIFSLNLGYVVFAVVVSTIIEILISGAIAFLVRWLMPAKWFSIDNKIFCAGKNECRFYEKLGIKVWKDKVLELGCFTSFRKNKIQQPTDKDYVKRFIVESNFGVAIHALSVPLGFLVILVFPIEFFFMFGLPVAIVGAVLNLMPMFILRYNLKKLHRLYNYNLKREQKTI